jgi:hypothetical protein
MLASTDNELASTDNEFAGMDNELPEDGVIVPKHVGDILMQILILFLKN